MRGLLEGSPLIISVDLLLASDTSPARKPWILKVVELGPLYFEHLSLAGAQRIDNWSELEVIGVVRVMVRVSCRFFSLILERRYSGRPAGP